MKDEKKARSARGHPGPTRKRGNGRQACLPHEEAPTRRASEGFSFHPSFFLLPPSKEGWL